MSGFSMGLKIKVPVEPKRKVVKYDKKIVSKRGLVFQRPGEPIDHFRLRAQTDFANGPERQRYFRYITKYPRGIAALVKDDESSSDEEL